MTKAFLAYFSDYVLGAGGAPVAAATVTCYPASAFALGTLPAGGSPGVGATASATTDSTGRFTFAGLPPDDYHVLAQYTPPGEAPVNAWRYYVPVVAVEAVKRSLASPRAAGLPLTLGRLLAGYNATIFCLGDDTTVGYNASGTTTGGWVALMAVQLALLYPSSTIVRQDPTNFGTTTDGPIPSWAATTVQTGTNGQTITVVNAGVKGDTVLRAMRRFANLTTSWPASDCLIVQLGQGETIGTDAQRFVQPADFQAQLEALVNIIRTLSMAEILLCTPHVGTLGAFDSYAAAVRTVAARTRCDLCDLRQLWQDNFVQGGANNGYDPWLNVGVSALFPTDAGHAAMAGELARHFNPALAVPYATGPYGAAKVYETVRVPYTSQMLGFVGAGWAPRGGAQLAGLNSSGGSFDFGTSHAGDTVTIKGRFVDLAMLCRRYNDCGQVGVAVDGGAQTIVDLYRGYPTSTSDLGDVNGAIAPQDRVLLAHGLTDAVHTVVITLLASKNPSSSGTNWHLESLELGMFRLQGFGVVAVDPGIGIQRGAQAVSLVAQAVGTAAVTYPVASNLQGTAVPTVVATCQDSNYYCAVSAITTAGFTLEAVRRDGTNVTASPVCNWIMVG